MDQTTCFPTAAIVTFAKKFPEGVTEAVHQAKALSFSLRESSIPETLEGFKSLSKEAILDCDRVAQPEIVEIGAPQCEITNDHCGEVLRYHTSKGKTSFSYFIDDNWAIVVVNTDNLRDSKSVKPFVEAGWEFSFSYLNGQQRPAFKFRKRGLL